MSCYDISIEEIHTLEAKLKGLNTDCSNLTELIKVSELIDLILTR